MMLVELHGCAAPADAACALLLHQSCVARTWLESKLRDALAPGARASVFAEQLARCNDPARCPHADALPPAQAARAFLDSSVTAWARLEVGTVGVAEAVAALPPGMWALSLQLAPDGSACYAAVVAGGEDGVPGLGAAVARYPLAPTLRRELVALRARAKQWRAALGRALLRYADEVRQRKRRM